VVDLDVAHPQGVLGEIEGEEVMAQNGRFGPFIKKGTDTRSLGSEAELLTVTLDGARALLAEPKRRRGQTPKPPLREPGNEDVETVASGLAAAAHGGFTTVCAMPNTTPALDEPSVLARVREAAAASGSPVELHAHGAVTVVRKADRLRLPDKASDGPPAYFFESLDYPVADRKMEAFYAEFEPRPDASSPHQHEGSEFIYVLGGKLVVTVGDADTTLGPGDSMIFNPSVPHSYRADGLATSSAIVVVVPTA